MSPSGRFRDSYPKELLVILERDIVNRRLLALFRSRADSIVLRPGDGSLSAWIGTSGLINQHPTVTMRRPDGMPFDVLKERIAATGATGGEPRKTMGHVVYDFAPGTDGEELVAFALDAMRALGATDDGWEWETVEAEGA